VVWLGEGNRNQWGAVKEELKVHGSRKKTTKLTEGGGRPSQREKRTECRRGTKEGGGEDKTNRSLSLRSLLPLIHSVAEAVGRLKKARK